jgi:hypothetical protein
MAAKKERERLTFEEIDNANINKILEGAVPLSTKRQTQ